tara:strand:- start:593 stop:769 length:177 start_codon:yes stop_codon:yes gene_type:complete
MITASDNELFIELIKELGVNLFNQWYTETFGKPAPHIKVGNKGRGAKFKKEFKLLEEK